MEEKERVSLTYDQLPFSNKISKYIDKAVNAWINYNNGGGLIKDTSDIWYDKAEKLVKECASNKGYTAYLDRGVGLYPTFELDKDNQHYTEMTLSSFFKRINGFWD